MNHDYKKPEWCHKCKEVKTFCECEGPAALPLVTWDVLRSATSTYLNAVKNLAEMHSLEMQAFGTRKTSFLGYDLYDLTRTLDGKALQNLN